MGAIVRQPIKARATSYHSCKNDSGGLAWPMTSETALENAVGVRSLRPPHRWPIEAAHLQQTRRVIAHGFHIYQRDRSSL